MIIDDTLNADRLIAFLKALVHDSSKKVFLILDNLRVHHSKVVKAWVLENKEKIDLFYLPSYSPERNPDERLNADLKYAIGSKVAVRTKDKLKLATEQHMQTYANICKCSNRILSAYYLILAMRKFGMPLKYLIAEFITRLHVGSLALRSASLS